MNAASPLTLALGALVSAALAGLLIVFGEKATSKQFEGQLYSLKSPDGESADTEQFFQALHGMLPSMSRSRSAGRAHISLEIAGSAGRVRYLLWIPKGHEDFVRSILGATHPGLELSEQAADPVATVAPTRLAAIARLNFGQYLPIRVKFDQEPLATMLATLARAAEGEAIAFSVLARPRATGWQRVARARAHRLRHPSPSQLSGNGRATSPTPFGVEQAKAIEGKAALSAFDCNVRVVVATQSEARAKELLRSIAASLRQFDGDNSIRFQRWFVRSSRVLADAVSRRFHRSRAMLLTTAELAALWHLPKDAPQQVERVRSAKLAPPRELASTGRILGESTFPGSEGRPIRIGVDDSRRHCHALGGTGSGKSTLLAQLALQDIHAGLGVAVLDPKGDLFSAILDRLPRSRARDVLLISPDELEYSIGINPLEYEFEFERDLIADNVFSIFKRFYSSSWGPRTADILLCALLTIMRTPTPTLADIPLLLTDAKFRTGVLSGLDDPLGLDGFWKWFDSLSDAQRIEAVSPLLNKIRSLMTRPRIRRLLCQSHANIDLRKFMDGGGILLVNLSSGQWGQETSALLGSLLVAKIWQAARSRADTPEAERPDFSLYVDEFQEMVAGAGNFADALAQARSYHLSLTLANQHLGQLPKEIVSALSSNARTRIAFQCGQDDSRYLAREFAPLDAASIMSLPRYEMAIRVSVNGETSAPLTARALPLAPAMDTGVAKFVSDVSRSRFARPAADIDAELRSHLMPAPYSAPVHGVGRRPLDKT